MALQTKEILKNGIEIDSYHKISKVKFDIDYVLIYVSVYASIEAVTHGCDSIRELDASYRFDIDIKAVDIGDDLLSYAYSLIKALDTYEGFSDV